jgi:hypothetical protein
LLALGNAGSAYWRAASLGIIEPLVCIVVVETFVRNLDSLIGCLRR